MELFTAVYHVHTFLLQNTIIPTLSKHNFDFIPTEKWFIVSTVEYCRQVLKNELVTSEIQIVMAEQTKH